MHLYTLVATAFVAQLLLTGESDPEVGNKASIIQAAFLVGWALGVVFFGIFNKVQGDFPGVLLMASYLFIPAAFLALLLPEPGEKRVMIEPG